MPTLWTISASFPGVHSIVCPNIGFPNSAIANQESLSALETEMRKLEGIVKEIVEEMDYLKKREEKFQNTNGACSPNSIPVRLTEPFSIDEHSCAKFCVVHNRGTACARRMADNAPTLILQA